MKTSTSMKSVRACAVQVTEPTTKSPLHTKVITFEIGALAEPLSVQLERTRIPEERLHHFDRCASAIARLYVHGLLSEAEFTRAGKRLIRQVQDAAAAVRNSARKSA